MRTSEYLRTAIILCFVSVGFFMTFLCWEIYEIANEPTYVTTTIPLTEEDYANRKVLIEENKLDFEEVSEMHEEYATQEWDVEVTPQELELMSRVVMSEASILPFIGKVAVASVLVNRLKDGSWGETMTEVIEYPNAFSTANNGEVTDECRTAVLYALDGTIFPEDMLYFRTDHAHEWGYLYCKIGNTYFSTLNDYEGLVGGM